MFVHRAPSIANPWRQPVNYFAGIDVSLESSSVCIVDAAHGVYGPGASHDQAWFSGLLLPQQRTNLAASPKTTAICNPSS